jgi:hypothetical protein
MAEKETRSYRPLILGISAIAIGFVCALGWRKAHELKNEKPGGDKHGDVPGAVVSAPEPPPRPEYHRFTATTDLKNAWTVRTAGWDIRTSPVDELAYDIYIDGKFFDHVPPGGDKKPGWQLKKINMKNVTNVSYVLSPGQGMEKAEFRYVKFVGDLNETDKVWFTKAGRAPDDSSE